MPSLKSLLTKAAYRGETSFDRVRQLIRERLNLNDNPQILPYYGFGNQKEFHIRARVLQARQMSTIEEDDAKWENVVRAYQRINSREIPFVRVQAHFHTHQETFTADDEGFVMVSMQRKGIPAEPLEKIELSLPDIPESEPAEGIIFTPHSKAKFGIISDIDDTILVSHATNYAQAAQLLFTGNFHTRLPFHGVAEFYQGLVQGSSDVPNPIFYVSSSPWNIFDMLTDFMELRDIPLGPLFLKDYGISETAVLSSGHGIHKTAQIDTLMATYPDLPFVLIGDSGQHDPEIYAEIVKKYPQRVTAIYIRDVTLDDRDIEVKKIARGVTDGGVPMVLAADSLAAAEHAFKLGLLNVVTFEHVRQAVTDQ